MNLTTRHVSEMFPKAVFDHELLTRSFVNAATEFDLGTKERLAVFFAQIAHETAGITRLEENLNYSAAGLLATWPKRFSPAVAATFAKRGPKAIANYVYSNRNGNRGEKSEDGWNYRGAGLIQLTGRRNFERAGDALGLPLTREPGLAKMLPETVRIAGWFFKVNNLNAYSDAGNFDAVSDLINMGRVTSKQNDSNGALDRVAHWERAKAISVNL